MEDIVIKMHSTDLVGTCDKAGVCSSLDEYLAELQESGLDDHNSRLVEEQRLTMCENAGRCTLYYGLKEQGNA